MARLKSLLKMEGSLDGMSFYKDADGVYQVRAKRGVDKSRIQKDAAFQRTRENNQEFSDVSIKGKLLRRSLIDVMADVKDRTKSTRMSSVLFKVKSFDTGSIRGERKVSIGILTPEGKVALSNFEFNKNAPLDAILLAKYALNTTTNEITITGFNPYKMLATPEGATHVRIVAAHAKLDFATEESDLVVSNVETIAINETVTDVTLSFTTPATGSGTEMHLLKVEFLQEFNAALYPLKNGTFNALKLISVQ